MMFQTHLAFAFLVSIIFLESFAPSQPLVCMVIIFLFAALPDIDYAQSKIGKTVWPLSLILQIVFKHRGIFHSIFVPLSVFGVLYVLGYHVYASAAVTGYLSHLILDALNTAGIKPFDPLVSYTIRGPFKTGRFIDYALFVIFIAVSLYIL